MSAVVLEFPLPRWPHRPGSGSTPDRAALDGIMRQWTPRYDGDCVPSSDLLLRHGLRLNDAGFFWEAHEMLEAVWKAAPKGGVDRIVLRGCIQIANANLKMAQGNARAASRLIAEAEVEFDEARRRGPALPGSFSGAFDPTRLGVGQRPTPVLLEKGWT